MQNIYKDSFSSVQVQEIYPNFKIYKSKKLRINDCLHITQA